LFFAPGLIYTFSSLSFTLDLPPEAAEKI